MCGCLAEDLVDGSLVELSGNWQSVILSFTLWAIPGLALIDLRIRYGDEYCPACAACS